MCFPQSQQLISKPHIDFEEYQKTRRVNTYSAVGLRVLKWPGSLSFFVGVCGGLSLAGCQRPAALFLPSLALEFVDQEQDRKTNCRPIRGKTDLTGRIQFNLLPD